MPPHFVNYTDERYRRAARRYRGAHLGIGKFAREGGCARKPGMHHGNLVLLVSGIPVQMNTILYVVGWAVFIAVIFWLEGMSISERADVFQIGLLTWIASQLHGISKQLDRRGP